MSENSKDTDFDFEAIRKAVVKLLSQKMEGIGIVISEAAEELAEKWQIRDTGAFIDNIGYDLEIQTNTMTLTVGSNVKHEPYVLGGKVPSWTPLAPLKAWVIRKNLTWLDKKTGEPLTVDQIARIIQMKIKRDGIDARNIFAEVIKDKEKWIYEQLESVEIKT